MNLVEISHFFIRRYSNQLHNAYLHLPNFRIKLFLIERLDVPT